ncbi:hypothetical protein BCR39DRAFT_554270 [Naematelia encephala]|uniref:Zn(2)-C6 fungal-type domain-containing protein n=1 Tax=Naematelia encephala TaxID=71784 RepID=A0A1Y2AEZ4_9TREE|nr:hypothetical protein BCR39DRAFT_554270 [Naematelia encephala]
MQYIQPDPSTSFVNLQDQPQDLSYAPQINFTDALSPRRTEAIPTQGRVRRSRKNRPCDLCRNGKSRCSIGPSGPPCTQCLETGKRCTFDAAPPPRRPRKAPGSSMSASPNQPTSLKRKSQGPWAESSNMGDADESMEDDDGSGRTVRIESASTESFEGPGRTLDGSHVLTNPLTDDLLPIVVDEPPSANQSRVQQISGDPNRPTFVIFHPTSEVDPATKPGLSQIRMLISAIGRDVSEADLIQQYYVRVHPAWPILPKGKLVSRSPLLAAVIATAMRHSSATRPYATLCADILCQMTAQATDDNLIGVAVTVLELGLTGSACSRSNYLKLARVIALAQLLGMHVDPQHWRIPQWEKDLRIRLWWCLAIHDAWMSFLNSRPCHIQAHNSTVPMPALSTVLEASCAFSPASSESSRAFISMCRLATYVARLQTKVSTLGALSSRSSTERREEVHTVASLVDTLLAGWKSVMFDGFQRPTGVASLLIFLLGFRCMLERIQIELEFGLGSTFSCTPAMLVPFRACVDFVHQINMDELDGYFLTYAGHILSAVMSSLIRLSLASSEDDSPPAVEIVAQFVAALEKLQADSAWDIAQPALRRAQATAARLRSQADPEHQALCEALSNGGSGATKTPTPMMPASGQSIADTMDAEFVWTTQGSDWDIGSIFPT